MKRTILLLTFAVLALCVSAQKRDKAVVKKEKQLVGNFVEIPAQHFTLNILDSLGKVAHTSEYTTAGFYMMTTEVSRASYNAFLKDLQAQGRMEDYAKASIQDTALEKISRKYKDWNAPDFGNYPVANISYEGALLFCQWLTDKVGSSEWKYTLPDKIDWQVAAWGGNFLEKYANGSIITPLDAYRYTFFNISADCLTKTEDGYRAVAWMLAPQPYNVNILKVKNGEKYLSVNPATTPVVSHDPNLYGLYNMCGNVAEMVYGGNIALGGSWADPGYDIRIQSEKTFTGPSPMVGFRVIAVRK